MPDPDLPLLIAAIRQAGQVALSYTGATVDKWDKAGNAGPVTAADLAVNDSLHQILRTARPDYGWLSEETEDTGERLRHDRVFIIDPIDGTRSFIEGSDTWAISLAIAEQGRVTEAAVYLPQRNQLFAARQGAGATLNDQPLQVSTAHHLAGATILAAKPALAAQHWPQGTPEFKRSYRPSLAYRMCLVASGKVDGMLTLRPTWEWDVAAGTLIVEEAGGRATTRQARALQFNQPQPLLNGVVAAGPVIHTTLTRSLNPT